MRRLFRAIGIERGRHVDQILDSELNKKLKESDKKILPQKEVLAQNKEQWLLIKQEFLIRNMLHEEIQFVKDLLITHRNDALKPLQEAHNIWTDNCNLKPLLANIKDQLVTYQDQLKRRLQEEKDTQQTFSMDSYNYEMCQLDLQKRTLQSEIELTEKAINFILNGQEVLIPPDPESAEDLGNIGQNLQMLNRKLKMINHEQNKIEQQIVGLENDIDLYNEGHFIKSGFIQNGSKIMEIIRDISDINLKGTELASSESALSKRYWFFNCQHQTTEKKQECMLKSIQTFEQLKPTKYSPSSHGYIASANYLRHQIGLAFSDSQTSKLNQSIKDSKSLILLNLNNLSSPGMQLNQETKQSQIDQLNTKKMDFIAKFNNSFHDIIQMTKKQTNIKYTQQILQTLQNCKNQDEKFAQLNNLIESKTAEISKIDALKIQAYNNFRKNESIRNLQHLIESLQDQVRWRQKAEDIRIHLEKQMQQIDKFFEKRTALCLSNLDRDLAFMFNRNKEMSTKFKQRNLFEFNRLDEQFERQFLRMNFGRVQGFQELQNIFELSQQDNQGGANGFFAMLGGQQNNNGGGNAANGGGQNNNNNNNNANNDRNMQMDMDDDEMAFLAMMHRDRDGEFEMMDEFEDMMEMRRDMMMEIHRGNRLRRPQARRNEVFNNMRMRVDDGMHEEFMFMDEPVVQEPLQQREIQQQEPRLREQPVREQPRREQPIRERPQHILNFDMLTTTSTQFQNRNRQQQQMPQNQPFQQTQTQQQPQQHLMFNFNMPSRMRNEVQEQDQQLGSSLIDEDDGQFRTQAPRIEQDNGQFRTQAPRYDFNFLVNRETDQLMESEEIGNDQLNDPTTQIQPRQNNQQDESAVNFTIGNNNNIQQNRERLNNNVQQRLNRGRQFYRF